MYDPNMPIYRMPIAPSGFAYTGADKTRFSIEEFIQYPNNFKYELRKCPLLLPDNAFGHAVAGQFLMLGIDAPHHILKRGQSLRLFECTDEFLSQQRNSYNKQTTGAAFLFCGMPRFHLNVVWREEAQQRKHVLSVMYIPGDYECPRP